MLCQAIDNKYKLVSFYLISGIFIDISEVLSDAILNAQVFFSEIDSFFVAQNGSRIGSEKFLFHAHVMIGYGKDSSSIFRVSLPSKWSVQIFFIFSGCLRV